MFLIVLKLSMMKLYILKKAIRLTDQFREGAYVTHFGVAEHSIFHNIVNRVLNLRFDIIFLSKTLIYKLDILKIYEQMRLIIP
jgi:hypothetical protein